MKKRVVALALAAAMSLGAVTSVAAEEKQIGDLSGSAKGEVMAKVDKLQLPEQNTYLVTVTIPEMAFEYSFGTAGAWNTDDLKYEAPSDAGWKGGENPTAVITVTNKSDAAVTLNCKYEDAGAVTGVSGAITNDVGDGETATLESAVNASNPLDAGEAKKANFTLTISGTPDKEIEASTKIGTVTLTLSAVA